MYTYIYIYIYIYMHRRVDAHVPTRLPRSPLFRFRAKNERLITFEGRPYSDFDCLICATFVW